MNRLPGVEVLERQARQDPRGLVMEVLRGPEGPGGGFGQIYISTAHPGVAKGNHYHRRKTEWFCVIQGSGRLALVDVATGAREEIEMGDRRMVTVRIPPGIAHGLRNTGPGEMVLLAYITEAFDPADPDTIPFEAC